MAKDGINITARMNDLSARINTLVSDFDDLKPLHEDLGEEMIDIIRGRFDTSTDVNGRPFKPIAPYVYRFGNQRRERRPGDPPLKVGLGAPPLRNSFEYEANNNSVIVGTPVNHAKYHSNMPNNNGNPRTVLPLREFMGIETDEDYSRMLDIVEDFVERIGE